ncbi:MAG: transglycosylase SLT domain-containing protein [Candidatus Pacearchaeota archaeon]
MLVSPELKSLIFKFADRYLIDRVFLLALCKTESEFNIYAQRFEPVYPYLYSVKELSEIVGCNRSTMEAAQRTSYSISQIMGAVAYELGFRGWPAELFNPEISLKYSCEYIRRIVDKYDLQEYEEMYAAYNAGRVRKVDGRYVNQSAVTRFNQQLLICSGIV